MHWINNCVITDDQFLQPKYRISPFKTNDMFLNSKMEVDIKGEIDFSNWMGSNASSWMFTTSGRDALRKAILYYNLKSEDVVTIFTTTGNFYISGCVTKEIEKICKWSREIEDNTKVILVNHEFGFPYEKLSDVQELGFPIIEDCAHSFASQNQEKSVGKVGDFVIYSLPKFFSVQGGGILKINNGIFYNCPKIAEDLSAYFMKVVSCDFLKKKDVAINTRIYNYNYLASKIKKLNLEVRFDLKKGYCPGVFMFKSNNIDLNALKEYMQFHGVECSVFYGEDSFFIPVNQALNEYDLDYFIELIKYFSINN